MTLRGGSLQLSLQLPGNARNSFAAFAAFCAAFAAFFAAFLQLSCSFRSFLAAVATTFAAPHKYQNVLGCLGACTSLAQLPTST